MKFSRLSLWCLEVLQGEGNFVCQKEQVLITQFGDTGVQVVMCIGEGGTQDGVEAG